jgi:hypothetical protein
MRRVTVAACLVALVVRLVNRTLDGLVGPRPAATCELGDCSGCHIRTT